MKPESALYLLFPEYFKWIALTFLGISFAFILFSGFWMDMGYEVAKGSCKIALSISLLIIALTKVKHENEATYVLRLQSIVIAFLFFIVVLIYESLSRLLGFEGSGTLLIAEMNPESITLFLLFFFNFYFRVSLYMHNKGIRKPIND